MVEWCLQVSQPLLGRLKRRRVCLVVPALRLPGGILAFTMGAGGLRLGCRCRLLRRDIGVRGVAVSRGFGDSGFSRLAIRRALGACGTFVTGGLGVARNGSALGKGRTLDEGCGLRLLLPFGQDAV